MDFKSLQLFDALAGNLHFGRTSEEHNISPSALSRSIQRMEQELGCRLLLRDNRSVSLTPQGEMFRDFARATVWEWDEFQVHLNESTGRLTGKLTLFASVTASQSILPRVLSRFREQYPDIHIQLETGYAVNALSRLREGCDVVVAALSKGEDPDLAKHIITSTPILTIAPIDKGEVSELLDRPTIDWSSVPLILPTPGQARDNINRWIKDRHIVANIYSEVSGNEAVMPLVALGCGVGFVPRLVMEISPLKYKVRIVPEGPELSDFHVGFCTRRSRLDNNPLIRAFWDTIEISPGGV